jgi:hypothetical protein
MITNVNKHISFIKVGYDDYIAAYVGYECIWMRYAIDFEGFLKYNYENFDLKFKNTYIETVVDGSAIADLTAKFTYVLSPPEEKDYDETYAYLNDNMSNIFYNPIILGLYEYDLKNEFLTRTLTLVDKSAIADLTAKFTYINPEPEEKDYDETYELNSESGIYNMFYNPIILGLYEYDLKNEFLTRTLTLVDKSAIADLTAKFTYINPEPEEKDYDETYSINSLSSDSIKMYDMFWYDKEEIYDSSVLINFSTFNSLEE